MPLWRKYRPTVFVEFYGSKRLIEDCKAWVKKGDMPHLLLEGPAGRGKTVLAECLRNEFGLSMANFKEINASDDRGVKVVREQVKNFAKTARSGTVPFKIMLIDEADGMTKIALGALKRTMELYPHIRFILTCNDVSKVIKPVRDRCQVYKFKAMHYKHMEQLIADVARKEGQLLSPAIVTAIRQVVAGSPRKAMNILETVLVRDEITVEDIHAMVGTPDAENVFALIYSMLKGSENSLKRLSDMLDAGTDPAKIIRMMHGIAFKGGKLTWEQRVAILRGIGNLPGSTEEQRLSAIVGTITTRRMKG
ncbi:AAA family ATPase [bacterium]|nr:MAG: AAA family ATPase [bacterium]